MVLEGITKDFSAVELIEIQQQLSAKLEKWCNEPFSDSAVLRIKHPKRGGEVEIRLFFKTKGVFVAQVKDVVEVGDYEVSFYGIDTILYHNWGGEGAGVEFQRIKNGKKEHDILRIHANGVIRVEA